MSQSSRLSSAFVRVGTEIKTLKSRLATSEAHAKKWEQEILVQSGTRMVGMGPAGYGIYIPYNIRILGVSYQFGTSTSSGTSTGRPILIKNDTFYDLGAPANLNIAANFGKQKIFGLSIDVDAGSRIAFRLDSVGTGTVGKGLYMGLWGEYR